MAKWLDDNAQDAGGGPNFSAGFKTPAMTECREYFVTSIHERLTHFCRFSWPHSSQTALELENMWTLARANLLSWPSPQESLPLWLSCQPIHTINEGYCRQWLPAKKLTCRLSRSGNVPHNTTPDMKLSHDLVYSWGLLLAWTFVSSVISLLTCKFFSWC